jgi:hypothetical protein
VPFILNYPLNDTYAARAARGGLRSFHIFDFAINGVTTDRGGTRPAVAEGAVA